MAAVRHIEFVLRYLGQYAMVFYGFIAMQNFGGIVNS